MFQEMSVSLITIHGTFAPKAPWAQPSSPFCRSIVPDSSLKFEVNPIDWSGNNTFEARLCGAANLIHQLESNPNRPTTIVAHSHGGSVAQYAYRLRPDLFANVKSVVCMSTPYFGFSIRPGYDSLTLAAAVASFILIVQASLVGITFLGHAIWRNFDEHIPPILLCGGLAMVLSLLLFRNLFSNRERLYGAMADHIDRSAIWDTSATCMPNLTIVRSMADEVAIGLASLQFVCAIASYMLNALAIFAQWGISSIKTILDYLFGKILIITISGIIIILSALPAALSLTFGSNPKYWIDLLWMFNSNIDCILCSSLMSDFLLKFLFQTIIFFIVFLEAMAIIFLAIFLSSWLLSTIALRALGAWNPIVALTTRFAVEPTPEGRHSFLNAGWERSAQTLAFAKNTLQHSDPYISKNAAKYVADVLKSALNA